MRCLVTGGAGFLGSHLCDRLMSEGHEVIALDNLHTGTQSNLSQLAERRGFRFVRHDIVEPVELEADWIFNLACPASPVHYQAKPLITLATSVYGTHNMLKLAKKCGARILQASTSEVYGDPDPGHHPQTESYWGHVNPIGVRACYDEGKRVAETLMMDYYRCEGVDTRIARIFNTYGPRMTVEDGRVISNFIVQSLQDKPLTVYGDGSQTRSFCYVDDLIDGLVRLMQYEGAGAEQPVNLGSADERTMKEVVSALRELLGKELKVEFRPLPSDDPQRRRPDCARARERLGWTPKTDLHAGLKATVKYFQEKLGG